MRAQALPLALVALASSGCVVVTPPTRALPLESAETAGGGRTGEQIAFARDVGDPDLYAGTLGVRRGIDAKTDVEVEATGWSLPSYAKSEPGCCQRAWSGRAGIKRRLARSIAVEGGAGGGIIAGTPFAGPDLGVIAAWENGIFVPFLAVRGAATVPFAATVTNPGDPSSTLRPDAYGQLSLGARIPLGDRPLPPRPGELRGSLLAGYGWTWFADTRNSGRIDGFAVGGELTF